MRKKNKLNNDIANLSENQTVFSEWLKDVDELCSIDIDPFNKIKNNKNLYKKKTHEDTERKTNRAQLKNENTDEKE